MEMVDYEDLVRDVYEETASEALKYGTSIWLIESFLALKLTPEQRAFAESAPPGSIIRVSDGKLSYFVP